MPEKPRPKPLAPTGSKNPPRPAPARASRSAHSSFCNLHSSFIDPQFPHLFRVYSAKQIAPPSPIHHSSILQRPPWESSIKNPQSTIFNPLILPWCLPRVRPSFVPEVRIPALAIRLWRVWNFWNLKPLRHLRTFLSPEKELFLPSFRETNRPSVPHSSFCNLHSSFIDPPASPLGILNLQSSNPSCYENAPHLHRPRPRRLA